MSIISEHNGRHIPESEYFQPFERIIAGLSSNHVWMYAVERGAEIERDTHQPSDKTIVRIVRYQARTEKSDGSKYWSFRKAYNVRSVQEWESTSSLVDNFLEGISQSDVFVPVPVKEYDKLRANLRQEKSERRRLSAMISELKSTYDVELQLFKQKLSLMRSNSLELERVLNDYHRLIKGMGTTETQVHEFLIKHKAFWMFGLEYTNINSKMYFPPRTTNFQFDLMLQRYDGFWDLVELKGPNENLFNMRTSRRSKPNQALSEAVSQVFTYLHAIDRTGETNILKPKAYIVIGKEETDRSSDRRIFASYLNNVDLITHYELYKRGQLLLEHIKR